MHAGHVNNCQVLAELGREDHSLTQSHTHSTPCTHSHTQTGGAQEAHSPRRWMAAVVMMVVVVVGGNCEDTTPGAMRRRPSFLPPTQSQYSPTHRAPLRPVPPPQVRTGSAQSAMSIMSTPIQSSRVPAQSVMSSRRRRPRFSPTTRKDNGGLRPSLPGPEAPAPSALVGKPVPTVLPPMPQPTRRRRIPTGSAAAPRRLSSSQTEQPRHGLRPLSLSLLLPPCL